MFCTNCGNKNEAGVKFCPNCGNAFGDTPPAQTVVEVPAITPTTARAKDFRLRKKHIIFGSCFLAVIVVAIAVFVFDRNSYDLDGRWNSRRTHHNAAFFVFSGNRFTYVTYQDLRTDRPVAADDLTIGGFYRLLELGAYGEFTQLRWGRRHPSHVHEIVNQMFERNFVVAGHTYRAYMSLLRTSVTGTFSISDGMIELVWPDDRGIEMRYFSQTENTITIGYAQYHRWVEHDPELHELDPELLGRWYSIGIYNVHGTFIPDSGILIYIFYEDGTYRRGSVVNDRPNILGPAVGYWVTRNGYLYRVSVSDGRSSLCENFGGHFEGSDGSTRSFGRPYRAEGSRIYFGSHLIDGHSWEQYRVYSRYR